LNQGKIRIKKLIEQAKCEKLNQYATTLGVALDIDTKIANMP